MTLFLKTYFLIFKHQKGPQEVAAPHVTDNGDGSYDATYNVNVPGYYHVNITLADEPIQGSPYTVLVEGARSALSYAEGPGLEVQLLTLS